MGLASSVFGDLQGDGRLTARWSRRRRYSAQGAAAHREVVSQNQERDSSIPMTSSEAPVEIVPYDSAWPAKFEDEVTIRPCGLAPWLGGPIEHIGSTAVPGLANMRLQPMAAGAIMSRRG